MLSVSDTPTPEETELYWELMGQAVEKLSELVQRLVTAVYEIFRQLAQFAEDYLLQPIAAYVKADEKLQPLFRPRDGKYGPYVAPVTAPLKAEPIRNYQKRRK